MAQSRLYTPLMIGDLEVKHRIGMAPLTRLRATEDRVPTALMKQYYGQRAVEPGTLIISEGTFVSRLGGGFPHAPGIWREDQVAAWKTITDDVHSKGAFIYCQIFGMGRAANLETSCKEGVPILAPSAIPINDVSPMPREMTLDEIKETIQDFVKASTNAIRAGFDGVEIHVANGYLLDQFLQDVSNKRDDDYGGSIENRSRLAHEVIEAVAASIGPQRVGFRLSPWSTFQGMGMKDPIPQFTDLIAKVSQLNIAYIHLVESRIAGAEDREGSESIDFAYELWKGPILVAGGYTPEEARILVDERQANKDILVIFGRLFISNPDLVYRIKRGLALSAYNRETFYVPESAAGYSDYPYSPVHEGDLAGEDVRY